MAASGAAILCGAEKTFWPDNGMELMYPESALGAAYPFLNSGNIAGRAGHILAMLVHIRESVGSNYLYDDQRVLHMFYIANLEQVCVVCIESRAAMRECTFFVLHASHIVHTMEKCKDDEQMYAVPQYV
jgi:hypothetical protein